MFLDRGGTDNVLQIVVTFAPDGDIAASVKNDIIKSAYEELDAKPPQLTEDAPAGFGQGKPPESSMVCEG